jgi:acetyltransferase-like isoleucine patch superfamily enzyme
MFNASVTIDEVLDNPVVMKVRAYTSATDGIVKLVEFSSIVISKASGIGGGGASGNGGNEVFYENDTTITTSYDITTGKNAMTAGPIVINTNVEVVVPVGSSWTIV